MTNGTRRFVQSIVWAGAFIALPVLGQAQQTFDTKSEFNFYGHLNIGVLTVDDGTGSDSILTDNDNSNSRFGFTYDTTFDSGNTVRFQFETAIGLTGSSGATPSNDDFDIDPRITDLRRFDLQFTTKKGKFYLGQGSTSTDGIAERDLSGTGVATYSSIADLAGGNTFRLGDGSQSSVRINQAFSAFDGGRRFRVRYDTPSVSGFVFSGSFGTEVLADNDDREFTDFGVSYKASTDQFNFQAALGFSHVSGGSETVAGSASAIHTPTGLNLTIAAGNNQDTDASYVYVKAGILGDWSKVGSTALSVDYTEASDFASAGSDSSSTAVSVVQKVDRWNTEMYATYRTYEFSDTSGTSFQDIDATLIGARWKF